MNCNFFVLTVDEALWLEYCKSNGINLWMRKPSRKFNGDGVKVVECGKQALKTSGSHVLQQYIMDPMLFVGRKMDIRIWAIITSLDPLRVYIMQDGLAKVAAEPYVKTDFKNRCIHSTTVPSGCELKLHTSPNMPTHLRSPDFHRWVSYKHDTQFVDPIGPKFMFQRGNEDSPSKTADNFHNWKTFIWPHIHDSVLKTILMAYEKQRSAASHTRTRFRRFQWLHYDVLVDSTGHAWVEEVNWSVISNSNISSYAKTHKHPCFYTQ